MFVVPLLLLSLSPPPLLIRHCVVVPYTQCYACTSTLTHTHTIHTHSHTLTHTHTHHARTHTCSLTAGIVIWWPSTATTTVVILVRGKIFLHILSLVPTNQRSVHNAVSTSPATGLLITSHTAQSWLCLSQSWAIFIRYSSVFCNYCTCTCSWLTFTVDSDCNASLHIMYKALPPFQLRLLHRYYCLLYSV